MGLKERKNGRMNAREWKDKEEGEVNKTEKLKRQRESSNVQLLQHKNTKERLHKNV